MDAARGAHEYSTLHVDIKATQKQTHFHINILGSCPHIHEGTP